MSAPHHRLLFTLVLSLPSPKSSPTSFLSLRRLHFLSPASLHLATTTSFSSLFSSTRASAMPYKRRGGHATNERQYWKEKPRATSVDNITESIGNISISDAAGGNNMGAGASGSSSAVQFGAIPGNSIAKGQPRGVWLPKTYVTASEPVASAAPSATALRTEKETEVSGAGSLSRLFQGQLGENFVVDNNTFSRAQIRATFYPKFENEKSDQEIRARMIDMVAHGLATVEVSLKHSGSLFMYAGHLGGAYAKNSFGNIYTAVGVFVLARMFQEAWGAAAIEKQAEFNDFLEKNRMCISMELVTAVLGDHGQRPIDDYVVVTAVTELGDGKPNFFSTSKVIAFCRMWRLPTNHVWLFSSRKSVTSFFAAYDALCEEGTATPVCQALDEIADISIPGSKNHIKVQGEILEGLVARVVSHDSSEQMNKVLKEFPPPPVDGSSHVLGPNLREVCAANRADEKQQIKALLQSAGVSMCPDQSDWFGDGVGAHSRSADRFVLSKFLQAHPADYSTIKLQEMIRLMRQKHFPAAFKCYYNLHKIDSITNDHLYYKMVIHVHSDSAFRRYQEEMRRNRELWPLYRGFFIDIDLFKVQKDKASELAKESNALLSNLSISCSSKIEKDGLADDDANLMIKLKFLTYKIRTFLIRNGLSILFKDGPSAYKTYYLRQMRIWGTSASKQREISKMLDEWAVYIRRKFGHRQLSSSTYLSEAEPFLEQYARRSPQNQVLIGSAGNLVRVENFQAIIEGSRDEEGDLNPDEDSAPSSPITTNLDMVTKDEGLIVFFPGIPGCAKSALCKEILKNPGMFDDNRPVHSLMGDLIKGRYWPKVAEDRKKKPYAITLADKNAPNEEVWRQIEDMCRSTKASAIPVVPESEGTDSNPFSLDALAVFIFRVLQRVNHPGNLDKSSPNAGFVLLMFYHLYNGKNRKEFESELIERFGALVKMPLLKIDRSPLPDSLRIILEEGLNLYGLHTSRHGRAEPNKGSYAKEWVQWEKRLREVLLRNSDYLNSIQVPFDIAVKQVIEQLKDVIKGGIRTPESEKRRFGNLVFAAVTLPVLEIRTLLEKLAEKESEVQVFLKDKELENNLTKAHVTLAHKRSHGVTSVASYGAYQQQKVPIEFTALLFSDNLAALEARIGSINGEKISSKNEWPHATIWTGAGASAKDANALPQLHSEGKAVRIEIDPPFTVDGVVNFY
ncbi:tRNA ligase 1 [Dendrobium catenatum]|uniref:tRNA ligase 1 n=1 Tax=Dendrobium catenatum TaxID=906689 RepID=UPI0009F5F695|nr:tRNA ligase 1 [Dendrobium catenatum]